jgi:hypothetical protein
MLDLASLALFTNGTPATPSTESEKPDPYKAKLERLKQRPTYTKDLGRPSKGFDRSTMVVGASAFT